MTEDSFSKIPTQILEKLYSPETKLTNESIRVLLFIARKTYGWGKESDRISESQFVEALGIKKQNIYRAIKYLADKRIILITKADNIKGRYFCINDDVDSWRLVIGSDDKKSSLPITKRPIEKSKSHLSRLPIVITSDDKKSSVEMDTIYNRYSTIDTRICPDSIPGDQDEKNGAEKKKNKPSSKPKPQVSELHLSIADLLLERIRINKPNYKPNFSEPDRIKWAEHIRIMIERDKISPERIRAVIVWTQNDSFWRANILSTAKLREKFEDLELKMENQPAWANKSCSQQPETRVDYFNREQETIEDLLR